MKLFRDSSIRHKFAAVILSMVCLALSLACLGFGLYERVSFRVTMTSELSALADTLGANTAASLIFNDRKSAQDMLRALRTEKHIVAACLYDSEKKIFVEYRRPDAVGNFKMPAWHEDGAQFGQAYLNLFRTVSLDEQKVGSIAIISDFSVLHARLRQYAEIATVVLLLSVLATFLVASKLLQVITEPILKLAGIASRVSAQE